jgi:DNA-binding transcriptional LysR family regulator
MNLPDWTTLRIFLAAIECGSVTRAAEKCGIAVSAAAKRIQDLETELGVQPLTIPQDRFGTPFARVLTAFA